MKKSWRHTPGQSTVLPWRALPYPAQLAPVFAHLNKPAGSFPVAEEMAKRVISLPMSPTLTTAQQEKILTHCCTGKAE